VGGYHFSTTKRSSQVVPNQSEQQFTVHSKMEVDMVDKITAVLAGALMLFSAGAAPAQSGAGETLAYDQARPRAEQYCYLPSEPCDNNHRVSN
jgi:hypothetical protein